jgi:hypothetical protein
MPEAITKFPIKAKIHIVCKAGPGQPPTIAWKNTVGAEVRKQIPSTILDSWQSISLDVDSGFHAAEAVVLAKLKTEIEAVNSIRAGDKSKYPDETFFDLAGANPNPMEVIYIWNNGTRICIHQYSLTLGSSAWAVADPKSSSKKVPLILQLSWETKVA